MNQLIDPKYHYAEGWDSYLEGIPRQDNPCAYAANRAAWFMGWDDSYRDNVNSENPIEIKDREYDLSA